MRHSWSAKSTVLALLALLSFVACSNNSDTTPTLDSRGHVDVEAPRDTVPGDITLPDVLPDTLVDVFLDVAPVDLAEEDHKAEVTEETFPPDLCVPGCTDKECGDDGCGGSCGECPGGVCDEDYHVCLPDGWVIIQAGTFQMGIPEGEPCGAPPELSLHSVHLTRHFFAKITEVTQAEWTAVMETEPFYFTDCGGNCPAENISWYDALEWCNELSEAEGLEPCYSFGGDGVVWEGGLDCEGYRLPTEAEWEYMARAGTTTGLFNGDLSACDCGQDPKLNQIGWYCGNSTGDYGQCYDATEWGGPACAATHPVAQKEPNPWGLYDTAGSVYEWVWDWFQEDYYEVSPDTDPTGPEEAGEERVLRGGCFFHHASVTRVGYHSSYDPTKATVTFGFRPVRTLAACTPQCDGKACGDDGCGGSCGECLGTCLEGACSPYVIIPAGDFTMGTPVSEACRNSDEVEHQVSISHSFLMKATEVTQAEWLEVMEDANPAFFKNCGPDCPVEKISWFDAVYYCNKLSQQEGLEPCYELLGDGVLWTDGVLCQGYRLPTEAEWERAARGGTSTPLYNGVLTECNCGEDLVLDQIGWTCSNSAVDYAGCADATIFGGPECAGTHPVAHKVPNDYGLYDTAGNCWEWTWDWYGAYSTAGLVVDPMGPQEGEERVLRGGCWAHQNSNVRSGNRSDYDPSSTAAAVGFRPVRTILGDE